MDVSPSCEVPIMDNNGRLLGSMTLHVDKSHPTFFYFLFVYAYDLININQNKVCEIYLNN